MTDLTLRELNLLCSSTQIYINNLKSKLGDWCELIEEYEQLKEKLANEYETKFKEENGAK